jgi:uncharacterized damage-inducible protein DinB
VSSNPEKEKTMSLSAALLPEFDSEMGNLRRTLERVPDDKFNYKPHPKSATMGWLANHLANMPGWTVVTIKEDGLNFTADMREPEGKTTAEILAIFDKNVADARAAIAGAPDADLMKNWTLSSQGKEIFTMPRIACLRGMIMNHVIHHRGQLTVYLRLNDIPVPALYGPSADEGSF